MTAETVRAAADPEAVPLGQEDVPDVLRLTAETKPGPFLPRTIALGSYVGIRRGDELIAIGTRLVHSVVAGIEARGDRAFLHTSAQNTNAVRLYEALGFVLARRLAITTVTPRTG